MDDAGYFTRQEHTSIHDEESIRFTEEILQAGEWQLKVLRNGYAPTFDKEPCRYREENNRSAKENMDVVREKVSEWLQQGHVMELSEPAWCTNPLSVTTKIDGDLNVRQLRERICAPPAIHFPFSPLTCTLTISLLRKNFG
jgi:hypothetical protein